MRKEGRNRNERIEENCRDNEDKNILNIEQRKKKVRNEIEKQIIKKRLRK